MMQDFIDLGRRRRFAAQRRGEHKRQFSEGLRLTSQKDSIRAFVGS